MVHGRPHNFGIPTSADSIGDHVPDQRLAGGSALTHTTLVLLRSRARDRRLHLVARRQWLLACGGTLMHPRRLTLRCDSGRAVWDSTLAGSLRVGRAAPHSQLVAAAASRAGTWQAGDRAARPSSLAARPRRRTPPRLVDCWPITTSSLISRRRARACAGACTY
jgi:hypothetical protein